MSGLRHIALKSRDLKKTERFYTEILGLKIAFRVSPEMIFLRSPKENDLLNFIESNERIRSHQGLDHFGFKVSKTYLKALEKKLKQNGVGSKAAEVEAQSTSAIRMAIPWNFTVIR